MLARRKAKEINASKQNAASVSMKEETVEEAMSLKQLKQKFKGDIKKYEIDGYFKNTKANQAFMDYAMDNGEVKTDDPDEFEAWMDRDVLEGKKPVSKMTPAEKAANAKRRKEYNAYQKSKRNENVEEAKAPKIKGLSLYGSEITGLRQGMKTFSAKPVVNKGKLAYKVMDEFGGFETLDLKAFAKKFG